ncbi:LysR family transcriptional regulator [Pseudomonas oryzihabitans]|uniref:DNA-binding transcriptional regulator, LysR family n=1 Tax=Pseudomonas oryzihabitans TaxID=47885 RepID=A0A1G5PG57_9PSED|nr:LysR family transcriptional regulator [Pseudomonas psychrotolerans]NMY87736.1 LysR family transcriptional regulator [Pseudomonas psychrotolerans]SCZ48505.1 DNA-binding transcriptional regulator, LysR family [Pseudomonas psychrotolerans]
MPRHHYGDLLALIAVARERNFTRAAAQLDISQSMLSSRIRALEARLGVRLLTRTTRSVAVTQAGQYLLAEITPRLADIEAELQKTIAGDAAPAGNVRITATDHAIDTLLWPRLAPLLQAYPQLHLELNDDYARNDIVQGRFDFGVRLGDGLDKDTSAIRIGPDLRFAIVAAPAYLMRRREPVTPEDLLQHDCIALRLAGGGCYAWELKQGSRELNVRVPSRLVFNGVYPMLRAVLSAHGLAYLPEDLARPHLEEGRLQPVLEGWWRTFPGYHLFFARQHEPPQALQVVINTLRYTG